MSRQYLNDYDQFIKNAPWYYRLSRYFYRGELFGKEIPQTSAVENEVKILAEKQKKLSLFSQQTNPFVRWLLGLNLLIEKLAVLNNLATENLLHNRQKNDLQLELSTLSDRKLISTCSAELIKPLETHLIQQQDFIKTIPIVSYQDMPVIFWRFGRHNEIIAQAQVSGGKPMTYANLIAEKKASKEEIERARPIMSAKRKARTYRTYAFLPHGDHHSFFIPTYNSSDEDPGKNESDIIDGALSVVGQVDELLEELSSRVPRVEIGEDSKPYVKAFN